MDGQMDDSRGFWKNIAKLREFQRKPFPHGNQSEVPDRHTLVSV